MTGIERIGNLFEELWLIFRPEGDFNSIISFIAIIAIVVISLMSGKKFFSTFFTLVGGVGLLFVLNSISPILMWGLIAVAILVYFGRRCGIHVNGKKIMLIGAVMLGVILAFINFFS